MNPRILPSRIYVHRVCPSCKGINEVTVSAGGYEKWLEGALIQHALPELTDAQREILMTGLCSSCFYKCTGEADG